QFERRHPADGARPARAALPRRNGRAAAVAVDLANVVQLYEPGQRPRSRVLSTGLRALRTAARARACAQRLSGAARSAGDEPVAVDVPSSGTNRSIPFLKRKRVHLESK